MFATACAAKPRTASGGGSNTALLNPYAARSDAARSSGGAAGQAVCSVEDILTHLASAIPDVDLEQYRPYASALLRCPEACAVDRRAAAVAVQLAVAYGQAAQPGEVVPYLAYACAACGDRLQDPPKPAITVDKALQCCGKETCVQKVSDIRAHSNSLYIALRSYDTTPSPAPPQASSGNLTSSPSQAPKAAPLTPENPAWPSDAGDPLVAPPWGTPPLPPSHGTHYDTPTTPRLNPSDVAPPTTPALAQPAPALAPSPPSPPSPALPQSYGARTSEAGHALTTPPSVVGMSANPRPPRALFNVEAPPAAAVARAGAAVADAVAAAPAAASERARRAAAADWDTSCITHGLTSAATTARNALLAVAMCGRDFRVDAFCNREGAEGDYVVPRSDAAGARAAAAAAADAAVAASASARPVAAADVGFATTFAAAVIAARDALVWASTCGVGVVADEFDNNDAQGDEGCVTLR